MKQKEIILISISAAIVVLAWIIFNVHHNATTSTISEALNMRILKINPNFDISTVEKLKKRKKIPTSFKMIQSPTPTGVASSPVATPSGSASLSPTPTLILISPTVTQTQSQITPE